MEEKTTVMTQNFALPLFHVNYDVIVGENMKEIREFVNSMCPNAKIKINDTYGGYTCILTDNERESSLYIMISFDDMVKDNDLLRRVTHECTHMSWYILDALGIEINVDNHEMQAYLIEELVDKVMTVANKFNFESLK